MKLPWWKIWHRYAAKVIAIAKTTWLKYPSCSKWELVNGEYKDKTYQFWIRWRWQWDQGGTCAPEAETIFVKPGQTIKDPEAAFKKQSTWGILRWMFCFGLVIFLVGVIAGGPLGFTALLAIIIPVGVVVLPITLGLMVFKIFSCLCWLFTGEK